MSLWGAPVLVSAPVGVVQHLPVSRHLVNPLRQRVPLPRRDDSRRNPPVRAGIGPQRNHQRRGRPHPRHVLAQLHPRQGRMRVGVVGNQRLLQGNVNVLSLASRQVPVVQGRQDGRRRVLRPGKVGLVVPLAHGRAVGLAGYLHEPAGRQRDQVRGLVVPPRAGLTEGGDRGHDQPLINLPQRLIPQPQRVHVPRRGTLQHHVRPRRQPPEKLLPPRAGQVQRDGPLVGVCRTGNTGCAPARDHPRRRALSPATGRPPPAPPAPRRRRSPPAACRRTPPPDRSGPAPGTAAAVVLPVASASAWACPDCRQSPGERQRKRDVSASLPSCPALPAPGYGPNRQAARPPVLEWAIALDHTPRRLPMPAANGPTARLCRWADETGYQDIPEEVRQESVTLLYDQLGGMIASATLPSCRPVAGLAARLGGAGECSIVGLPLRTSVTNAALANGTIAHGDEVDSTGQQGTGHYAATTRSRGRGHGPARRVQRAGLHARPDPGLRGSGPLPERPGTLRHPPRVRRQRRRHHGSGSQRRTAPRPQRRPDGKRPGPGRLRGLRPLQPPPGRHPPDQVPQPRPRRRGRHRLRPSRPGRLPRPPRGDDHRARLLRRLPRNCPVPATT